MGGGKVRLPDINTKRLFGHSLYSNSVQHIESILRLIIVFHNRFFIIKKTWKAEIPKYVDK